MSSISAIPSQTFYFSHDFQEKLQASNDTSMFSPRPAFPRRKRQLSETKNLRRCTQDKKNHRHLDDYSSLSFHPRSTPPLPRSLLSLPCNDAELSNTSSSHRRNFPATNHPSSIITTKPNYHHHDDSTTLSSNTDSLPRSPRLHLSLIHI